MNQFEWLVITLAFLFANLPFISHKLFCFITLSGAKNFKIHLLELLLYYFIVGFICHQIESYLGNAFIQTWQFYAITLSLFFVSAFPGFTYRYLMRQPKLKDGTL